MQNHWEMIRPGYWKAGRLRIAIEGKSFVAFRIPHDGASYGWNEYVYSPSYRIARFRSFESARKAVEKAFSNQVAL